MRKVIFVSDTLTILKRYRAELIRVISTTHQTEQYSIFTLSGLKRVYLSGDDVIVASNLKTNLIVGAFSSAKTLFIINGLGRYQRNKTLRITLKLMMRFRKKSHFAIQSYRDYRYFKKILSCAENLSWVPGSGGVRRKSGISDSFVFVSRASKYAMFHPKITLLSELGLDIKIIGVEGTALKNIDYLGYQRQDAIFTSGSKFLALSGYGEGIPHSLVDAITSNMSIIIEHKLYIDTGFYRYKNHHTIFSVKGHRFYKVLQWDTQLIEDISIDHVTTKYKTLIEDLACRTS